MRVMATPPTGDDDRLSPDAARAGLDWHLAMGAAEPVSDRPLDWIQADFAPAAPPAPPRQAAEPAQPAPRAAAEPSATPSISPGAAAQAAAAIARDCDDLNALIAAIGAFEGCPLKAAARTTVVYDGVLGADLMVVGEAPGRDEDRQGLPFVGRAGKLLDAMLAAIGRSRARDVLISNVIFWRPPANRTPSPEERAICLPFAERLIELARPKCLLLTGGVAAQSLLRNPTGIMRLRGVWRDYETPGGATIPALPSLHPAYLLRQSAQKRLAWRDLQNLQARLREA